MKLKKFISIIPAAVIVLTASVSCAKPYQVYTNIPQEYFTLGGECGLGGVIEGSYAEFNKSETLETENYKSKRHLFYGIMNTDAELVVSYPDGENAELNYNMFIAAVANVLNNIDESISSTKENSDINKFNAMSAGEEMQISSITYEVLKVAKDMYSFTDGCYNPALYYNVLSYGFGVAKPYPSSAEELPGDEEIEKYTDLSKHFSDIELKEDDGRHYVKKPEYTVTVDGQICSIKLDLGGIGKGYAVDTVDKLFDEFGYEYGYFNLGSSSMLVKNNVQQGTYNLGLANPRSSDRNPYLTVEIRNEKFSTSGDNEQRYFIDGKRYCHIIDPSTGKPVQKNIMSATVIGGGAAESDALSTAIMCMGGERAKQFVAEKLKDKKVAFICG